MGIVDSHPVRVVQKERPGRGLGALAAKPSERHQVDALVPGQVGDKLHQSQPGRGIEVGVWILGGTES